MAVPLFFIQLVLLDRQNTAAEAARMVATGWGGPQTVAGPLLVVPYTIAETVTASDGKIATVTRRDRRLLLPENLTISARADTETRRRGIFEVPVYRARINLQARFDRQALEAVLPRGAAPLWAEVSLALTVSDVQGLADNVALSEGVRTVPFQPGLGPEMGTRLSPSAPTPLNGIFAPLPLEGPRELVVRTEIQLRGAQEINFVPLGRRTVADIESSWPSPSFSGAFLPASRTINDSGFRAGWVVPYLARGFGQSLDVSDEALARVMASSFGVRLYQPVDYYQLVDRSLKYAILFVALAFLIFFVVETISLQRLHAVQYTMVGAAQVLFYLLLLSLSEHLGFAFSYLIAATATVAMTGLYAAAAFRSVLRAGILTGILAALYELLYVTLNAEDYALLIGAGVLFAALGVTMFVTRRIDWYGLATRE